MFTVETEQETDGRWTAEIPQIPGALAYGSTRDEGLLAWKHSGCACVAQHIISHPT